MAKAKNSNHFFLISFLPAIAYWYLESNFSIKTAVIGGLGLAFVEILFEKFYFKHIHKISWFNFWLVLFLAFLSLLGDDGIWFKLQPCFTGVFMGSFLIYRVLRGEGLMWETMKDLDRPLPSYEIWGPIERDMGIFMFCYGLFMAYVAVNWSTDQWLFFKTAGFYIFTIVFMVVEFLILRFVRMKTKS